MHRRRLTKRIFWTLLFLIFLVNAIAFLHAYKFTHYDSSLAKTKDPAALSFGDKLRIAFTGISNPRPQNQFFPDTTYQTIRLKSTKEIECWYIKTKDSKGTVAIFHGYGGEKSSMLDKAAIFRKLGYSTLLADFMGAGGSEGNQTTIGFKEAEQVISCYNYLLERGEKNIILFGTSLGATAIMKAINDHKLAVASIIIECPFSTLLQTVKNRFSTMSIPTFPMAYLLVFWGGVQNGFNAFSHNPVEYARNISCPTLLLYGERDEKVTSQETTSIFNNLAGPKTLTTFPLAGHENYLTKYQMQWTTAIANFLHKSGTSSKATF